MAAGRDRAVVCGLGGRIALPATYAAARRARVPFILWASLWAHPHTPAHLLSYLPMRRIYRHADAVVTYGPHVSRYVEKHRGVRGAVFEAPQACAPELAEPATAEEAREWRGRSGVGEDGFLALFAGRLEREKGIDVLLDGWERSGVAGMLALAGHGRVRARLDVAADVEDQRTRERPRDRLEQRHHDDQRRQPRRDVERLPLLNGVDRPLEQIRHRHSERRGGRSGGRPSPRRPQRARRPGG